MLHGQDLNHTDKDVDEVELQANSFVDGISPHETALTHSCVLKHLLDIVEGEATKDGETTIQPNVFSEGQGTSSGGWKDHGSETRKSDDGDTSKEGTTEVEILFLLGGGTNESDGAHHTDSVETSASEDSRSEEEHGREKSGLSEVEGGPEAVLGNVAAGLCQRHVECIVLALLKRRGRE